MRNSVSLIRGAALKLRDLSLLRQNRSATSGRLSPPRPFRPLSRRSGRISASPYPSLRCSQNGRYQPSHAMIFHWTATTPLTCCLTAGVHFIFRLPPPCPPSSAHSGRRSQLFRLLLLTIPATSDKIEMLASLRSAPTLRLRSLRNAGRHPGGIDVRLRRNQH
jgi:hypothetical protein